MRLIKAPEEFERTKEFACFLAGGCQSTEWHEIVHNILQQEELPDLVVYDPYNANIESHFAQVQWEFKYLNDTRDFIFSAYFDKYSNQPITMYELGRALALSQKKSAKITLEGDELCFLTQNGFPVVISYHEEAPLKTDLIFQCGLVHAEIKQRTPEEHAKEIIRQYHILRGKRYGNN